MTAAPPERRGMQAGSVPGPYKLVANLSKLVGVTSARGEYIPPENRVIGCDISHWSYPVDFNAMYAQGARLCYFKASQGTASKDDRYNGYRASCNNMPWGSYHFLTTQDGVTQANWFCDTMGNNPGAMPPVIDVELPTVASTIIRALVTRVQQRMGQFPLIYTSMYYWSLVTGADKQWIADRCPLWVASWGTDYPYMPTNWGSYVLHQTAGDYAGYGSADVDVNRCRQAWLAQFANPQMTDHERIIWLEAQHQVVRGY